MPTKTIILDHATVAVPDMSKSTPFKFDRDGRVIAGNLHVDHVPAGEPATFDADEADVILHRHGGKEVDPDTGDVIRVVPRHIPGAASRHDH